MWYSKRYRRHLCDMHIDDWNEAFLSEFSPEVYVENLKRAQINNAMLYLQSHVGLCYFPTKTGKIHRAFIGREDLMKKTVDLCHANDIRVTGYYSINYNTVEHDKHPEWRMVDANGKSRRESGEEETGALAFASKKAGRYGLCCPNHPEYRDFVYAQIDEMMDYFDCDALFFDMPFWPHTCYCEKCRERWAKEVGGEMPVHPETASKAHEDLIRKKYEWMGEWTLAITAHVKKRDPDMPVEFNYASGIAGDSNNGCDDLVNQASDYVGGDLYGGMLEHSFSCKFYRSATKNQPFEYMFSRCKPALRVHTLTKTLDEMKTSVAVTAAHHGATLVIDAIDPIGTMDQRLYERIGEMFDLQKPYEPYFRGEMIEDMGIYYGIHSKNSDPGEDYNSKSCGVAAAHTLMRRHIPFGVTGSFHDLKKYPVLIAPMLTNLEDGDHDRLVEYVKEGGILYLSGARDKALVEGLLGCSIKGKTETDKIDIAPGKEYEPIFGWFNEKYPLPFDGFAPIAEGIEKENVLATLTLPYTGRNELRFASIHSDPPGVGTDIPMLVIKKVGNGTVIWSAVALEAVDMDEYRDIFLNLLLSVRGNEPFSISSDASPRVEFTLFQGENEMLVNAVSMCDEAVSPALPGFRVTVKADRPAKAVRLLPDGAEIPFSCESGFITFKARELNIFDMYQIIF